MNQSDYLVSSDIASGVVMAVMAKLQCHSSTANLWKPILMATTYSIIGRLGENFLDSKMLSRAGVGDSKGVAYLRTEESRSSIIIFISSMVYSYVMKSKNQWSDALQFVASDVLASQIVQGLFSQDMVWWSATKV